MNRTSNINTKLNISGLNSQDYSVASAILSAHYQYDALYRLIQATGRELTSLAMPTHEDFPNNIPCPNTAPNALQNYTQKYQYDELGNIMQMKSVGNWTRDYVYQAGKNYLLKHDEEQSLPDYTYDEHGNMLSMPHLSSMEWDEKDQLHSATNGTFTSYYNYDAQGNRTRKVVDKGNIVETRYYFNGYEIFRKEVNGTLDTERTSLHIFDLKNEKDEPQEKEERKLTGFDAVFDKNQRIILIETLTVSDGSATDVATVRYQYSNHLGSACLELDENGQIISYEEYHPFGTTSYRSGRSEIEVSLKRYKYVGKERDEETGLYYYGARYYAAWLCRFVSVDSLQFEYPELTPYQYASNRPVTGIDLDGREVYITGEAAAAYYAEVQKGAATLGISTSIDEKGKLSATYSGEGEISANGQQLLDAINSTDIHIKINATNEDYTDDGRIFFGGAFMGNELINKKIGKDDFLIPEVNAFQTVNPGDLKTIDEYYDKPGQTSLHELTEAYQGGLLSQKNGIASPSSNILGTVYQQAHDTAIPQSGEIIPYYFDIKGEQIKVSRRSLYSIGYALPGKESLIKEVFLKSK